MKVVTPTRLLFSLLLLAGFATTSYGSSYPFERPGSVCDLSITSVVATNETCPGANDGTLTVEATCPSCAGSNTDIRYSIDNSDFSNTTGVFTGLAPGSYTVYVRDVNDVDCVDSDGGYAVSEGVDIESPLPDVATTGGDWVEAAKALASDGAAVDRFGYSVSISGNYAVVGAHFSDDNGSNSGAAYVFEQSGNSWVQQAKLTASDGAAGDEFGYSVSISGNYVVVGAFRDDDNGNDSGSAYIFERIGDSWTEQAKLTADDVTATDRFGNSVSISGDYAIVGAPSSDDNGPSSGSAYIFHRSGSTWILQSKLTASDNAAYDSYGWSVSISGDYAIVSAHGDDDNGSASGSAYIFHRNGTTWTQQAKLTASDAAANDGFGRSVSLSGNYAILGAYEDDDNGSASGSAYIFHRNGSMWVQQAKLTASDGAANDNFGRAVSISGDFAIVGAQFSDDNGIDSGSAYFFERSGTNWTQQTKLTASDGAMDDQFGVSVSISGAYAIVGANKDDDNGTDSGSAYFVGLIPQNLPIFTSECSATPPTPTATDNCAGTISGTTTTTFPITTPGTTTITWTYDDGNGNVTTQKQDVFLEDVTSPTAICPTVAPTVVIDGSGNGTLPANALAGGNSIDNCAAVLVETSPVTSFTCVDAPTATAVLTAIDEAGNIHSTNCTVNIGFNNCPCIIIADVTINHEICPDGHDGMLSVTAVCPPCSGGNSDIRYSIDNNDYSNTSGVFTGLAPGSYTVYVRDVNDMDCVDSDGPHTVEAGTDIEGSMPDVAVAGGWIEAAKALAADGAAEDQFGYSVSISGAYAIVGAYGDDDDGSESGSAYIFRRSGSTWTQQTKLKASDAAKAAFFGNSVSISEDYAIVGAYGGDDDNGIQSGSAYIFKRDGSTWAQQVKLTASDAASADQFGYSVSINGNYAVVGAHYDDDDGHSSGSVYVFERSGSAWTQQAKLTASDAALNDRFGYSVSINGDYAIVGAHLDDDQGNNSGSAYIFYRSGSTWMQQTKLTASDAAANDEFGTSVSINGDFVIVGAPYNDDHGSNSGSAYIFHRNGTTWTQQAKLTASDAALYDYFGVSVSISGNYVIVGAWFGDDNGTNSGSAYVFHMSDGIWSEQSKLIPSDNNQDDRFGYSVSISGNHAIGGAIQDNDNGTNSGSAYFFKGQAPGVLPAITAECSATPPTPTATDSCAGTVMGTTTAIFPITTQGTTTITWVYDDGNGNITTQNQDIELEDVTEPVAICPTTPPTVILNLSGNGTLEVNALAGGNSIDNCSVSPVETSPLRSFTCVDAPTAVVVLTATDSAGNINTVNCTVNVISSSCPYIFIDDVITINESCPGSNDGALSVIAACPYCSGGGDDIRYSIDSIDFSNTTGVFTGLVPGVYTVYVSDLNDNNYTDSYGPLTVGAGVDAEPPVPDLTSSGSWTEITKVLASDGETSDEFGFSVSINGDYAIVGDPMDDDQGNNSGSAYIFHYSGGTWTQQAKLKAFDGAGYDNFGSSVSIDGDYTIVGAVGDNSHSGSAYIFKRSGSSWTQQSKLTPADGDWGDNFGGSVSINGDYVIVGAYRDDDNGNDSGSAYIFHRSGSTWIEQAKLTANDGAAGDNFGIRVSISGDFAIVGASGDDNGSSSGSAYIFHRSDTSWTQQTKLIASDGTMNDGFGHSISISGDYAIVGAHCDDDNGVFSGSAYIYHHNGSTWSEQTKLIASDGAAFDELGFTVSINENFAVLGARSDDDHGVNSGSAYIYHRIGSTWTEQFKLTASDAEANARFGSSASVSGNSIIVGAPKGPGAAYFFNVKAPGDLPDIATECSATPPTPTATDNCAGTINGTTTTTFPITIPGTTIITWTYDDGNGNIVTQQQDVVLKDVTAPVAICPGIAPTVVLDDNGNGTLAANALAAANSTDNCTSSPTETSPMTSFTCADAPSAIVMLTATDAAGNTNTTNCSVNIDASNCCYVIITDVLSTDESCPGANDGILTIEANCIPCSGGNGDIRYSIDNVNFSNTSGMFTGLSHGLYTVYVRDVNNEDCTNVDGPHTIMEGLDTLAPMPEITAEGEWAEAAKVLADDGAQYDEFGFSVSISGDYAIVGAYLDDDNGSNSGSAYIFYRNGNSWMQQAKLIASDGEGGDQFGFSVSIDGDYAVVGASGDDNSSGSVYIFHRSGNNWTQQAKLNAVDSGSHDAFGLSVSISGDYVVVGVFRDDDNGLESGSAYIFHRSGSTWVQQAKLLANDGAAGDLFGISVAINGDYTIVGANKNVNNGIRSGSAYVFVRSGSTWVQQTKLTALDAAWDDEFGISVSISGDFAIVGAWLDDDNGDASGSAYIFERSGSNWTQQVKLTPSDGSEGDWSCRSVSISGNYAIVGAWLDDATGFHSGSAYIFHHNDNTWIEHSKLTASDGAGEDYFGYSVSIDNNYAIVGARWDSDTGFKTGSAYLFAQERGNLPPFTAECSATPPTPTATDNCTGTIIGTTTSTFPITTPGTTTITWTYDDGFGNITTQEQEIVLEDVTEPVITCPSDITVQATSQAGAVVTFADAMATDNCDVPTVTQTQGAASGSTFAAGLHIIVFEATDEASNTASCSFTIEVEPLVSVFNVGANGPIKLYQNIPNPFNEATRIGFELPEAAEVKLRITDVSGRELQLIEGRYAAGYHEVEVRDLPARGLFFYQLQTEGFTGTLKMVRE